MDDNESFNKNFVGDPIDDMEVVPDHVIEAATFESLPSVSQVIERKSIPTYEYFMYTLTNPNGYKGASSKRPSRAVSIHLSFIINSFILILN